MGQKENGRAVSLKLVVPSEITPVELLEKENKLLRAEIAALRRTLADLRDAATESLKKSDAHLEPTQMDLRL